MRITKALRKQLGVTRKQFNCEKTFSSILEKRKRQEEKGDVGTKGAAKIFNLISRISSTASFKRKWSNLHAKKA